MLNRQRHTKNKSSLLAASFLTVFCAMMTPSARAVPQEPTHPVIVVPKGARNAPILLTRTPYNASKRTARNDSPRMIAILPQADEVFVNGGYIRVFQDVRGKYKSEGDYVMTRPVRGALNPTETDHVTDAYDTIDWLVKNTPESHGLGGMIGSSYEGFTVVMALLDPHPALKVA